MQFNSLHFMIFFPIVLAIYFIIPKRLRMYWLLVASYYFYMSWNAVYAFLILGSTVITFLSGLVFAEYNKKGDSSSKRLVMIGCIAINLGILAVFKYSHFAINTVNAILAVLKLSPIQDRVNLFLPVGISFYTFQALGYIIDVYRGDVEVERNFVRYALFVSFFPQLVAGPIERSKNLLSQMKGIEDIKLWNAKRVTSGAILIVWGLFMKMVIADRVAILVDTIFDNYRMYGSTELIAAAIGFSIQIYCDFSSYSMIAIGAAKIMGFTLMENFNAPYFAMSIRDFWSRWHISLSTWFRDYVYIPLGGNRKGSKKKYINMMVVFLTSGLWHGANWTFVVWGALHGLYQIIGDVAKPYRLKIQEACNIKTDCFSYRLLNRIVTYVLVVYAWVFFRADSISQAVSYIKRMTTKHTPWLLFNDGIYNLGLSKTEINILLISLLLLLFVDLVRVYRNITIDAFLLNQNIWFEWFMIIALIVMIFIFGEYGPTFDAKQFIYFQF